jgi:hypothetical protein
MCNYRFRVSDYNRKQLGHIGRALSGSPETVRADVLRVETWKQLVTNKTLVVFHLLVLCSSNTVICIQVSADVSAVCTTVKTDPASLK